MLISAVLIFAFLFYKSTLSYYFISDDFLWFKKINNLFDLVKIDPFNNHYTPVVKSIGYFFTKIFASNPFPYHFYAILTHLINIYLVYSLSKIFFKDKLRNILSAVIFAFFFANYEVVFWYGATNNSLLVTFYILSLIFLIKLIVKPVIPAQAGIHSRYSILFQIFFILAFFTHEYAISLIPAGIIYWWMFTNKRNWKEFLKLFLIPIFVVVLTTILKIVFVQMPLTVRSFSIIKFFAYILRSFVYLFIPNPYLVDKIPNFFIPIIFLIILFLLIKFTKNKRSLFLLIWASLIVFIYSATSAPQARYFYLSSIPIILYIFSILKAKMPIFFIIYILFILISGIVFLQNQKTYWQLSSQITKNVIRDLKKYSPQLKKTEIIYFVDLPDSSNNDSLWKAYVFRAGFKELLNNFVNIYPEKIIFLTSKELSQLKGKNVVFVYKEGLKSIILIK